MTATEEVETFPLASLHSTEIVYVRAPPFPKRFARSLTLKGPVISQSGEFGFWGWLLVTCTIRDTGDRSRLSTALTLRFTGTILPFGGHRTFGVAAVVVI